MATLLLARHGETDWNRDHRWQGFTGPPLNEIGRRQAEDLGARLSNVDAIYSSDSARALETAEIVARRFRLPVATDARLREVNFGEWEGLTRHEINDRYGGAFTQWAAGKLAEPTGGESDAAMAERVLGSVIEIGSRHGRGECVLVVSSGGPIRAIEAHARRIDQGAARRHLTTIDNCALLEMIVTGDEFAWPEQTRLKAL